MWTVGIAEKEPFPVFHTMKRALGADSSYVFSQVGHSSHQPLKTDVLVAAGETPPETICRVAVISGGDAPPPIEAAEGVVTYGLSHKDTLTISSTVDKDMALALQREIMDVRGHRTDRQELLLRRPPHLGLEQTLACVGGLLALGVGTERIPALLSSKEDGGK